jgi:hypothetical protein
VPPPGVALQVWALLADVEPRAWSLLYSAAALLIINSVHLRSSHSAPDPSPIKQTHSPDFWAHLGVLEVSSHTSCDFLVSGAVLRADLRDIYRGTAVNYVGFVLLFFSTFAAFCSYLWVARFYYTLCIGSAHKDPVPRIVESNAKVFFHFATVVTLLNNPQHPDFTSSLFLL